MLKRKAAGANLITVDALLQAPKWVLKMFYNGLIVAARERVFPKAWEMVIYVLLRKPRGDQRQVCNRRDIALMANDLKKSRCLVGLSRCQFMIE